MWADRVVWLCLVGFLTAELMAQAALSFNGSNYLQPPPFLVPTDSPPSKLCNCGLWHFCLSLPMTVMVSLRFNIKQFHISFSGKRCTMMTRIKFYYTNQIDHPVLINILCVLTLDPIVCSSIYSPPSPRWPKNQLCSKGVCGARTSSLLVTSYAQLGNFHPLVLRQCPDGVYFGLTHKQSSLVKHRHHFSV